MKEAGNTEEGRVFQKWEASLKFVKKSLLISMCKENLYTKLEKLEAYIHRRK